MFLFDYRAPPPACRSEINLGELLFANKRVQDKEEEDNEFIDIVFCDTDDELPSLPPMMTGGQRCKHLVDIKGSIIKIWLLCCV